MLRKLVEALKMPEHEVQWHEEIIPRFWEGTRLLEWDARIQVTAILPGEKGNNRVHVARHISTGQDAPNRCLGTPWSQSLRQNWIPIANRLLEPFH